MSVGTASLPHHAREIGAIDLRQIELRHDNVELNFAERVTHGFRTIRYRDGSAAELLKQSLHH
jgi:hypothetical protein